MGISGCVDGCGEMNKQVVVLKPIGGNVHDGHCHVIRKALTAAAQMVWTADFLRQAVNYKIHVTWKSSRVETRKLLKVSRRKPL